MTTPPPAIQEQFCLPGPEPQAPGSRPQNEAAPGLTGVAPWCLLLSPLLILGFAGLPFSPHFKGVSSDKTPLVRPAKSYSVQICFFFAKEMF